MFFFFNLASRHIFSYIFKIWETAENAKTTMQTNKTKNFLGNFQVIINYNVQLLIISLSILGLDVEAFERLLGPCMEIMKRNIDDYESQLVKIFGSKNNITDIR